MGRVYLKLTKKGWVEKEKSDFWIDRWLLNKLENLKTIQKKNWDGVIVIDGKERSGKSVLGMTLGWYLTKGKLGINNFAKGLEDAGRKISKLPDKSVLIMDEGSLVFSSKDSNSTVQKRLIKLMDVVGQKNMIFIICLPCFFDLNKTIAVRRSLFLCHVYPDKKYNRGQYAFWGEIGKKILYSVGKKKFDSYAYPPAVTHGAYMDFEPPFYKDYLELVKKKSLLEVMDEAMGKSERDANKVKELEEIFYGWMKENLDVTMKKMTEIKNQPESTIKDRIHAYRELKKGLISKEIAIPQ